MTDRQHDAREHELVERNHLLALHADVGIALGTLDTGDALAAVANAVVRHLDAAFARIWTLSGDGAVLELKASAGLYTHLDGAHGRVPVGKLKIGLIAAERLPHLTNNVVGDPRVGDQEWARSQGMVSFAGYPMVLQGRLVGVIAAFARHPLSDAALSALQSIAGSVALGIERAQAMEDVRASERSLSATATELVEQAVVLRAAKDAAESANRTKSMFLANMSHELRTPLNAILGYSELLIEEVRDRGLEPLVPDLENIHSAGRHLLGLINDILDLSKIEAGKMELFLEYFAMNELLGEVEATVRPTLERRKNELRIDCVAVVTMHSDRAKLRQVILNILSNAAKFTENGRITLVVTTTMRERENVVVRVTDSGIGMTREQLDRLFVPFVQGDGSSTRRFGGSGLGLAISRHFCALLGGTIVASSEPGEGATFTITVPTRLDAPNVTTVVTDSRPPPG